jgi:LmbE family N-acetylglucosaminyl deacetylase
MSDTAHPILEIDPARDAYPSRWVEQEALTAAGVPVDLALLVLAARGETEDALGDIRQERATVADRIATLDRALAAGETPGTFARLGSHGPALDAAIARYQQTRITEARIRTAVRKATPGAVAR